MYYVKLLVVILLAGCLGSVLGGLLSQEQYGAADSDAFVRLLPADNNQLDH
jgi:hypothetical protein